MIVLFFCGIVDSFASAVSLRTQPSIRRIARSVGTAALLAAVICAGRPAFASAGDSPKRILILYSFYNGEGVFGGFDPALRSALRTKYPGRVEFHNQYLDLGRFPDAHHQEMLAESLRLQYSQTGLDLIIPVSLPAVNFLLQYGDRVFPGIPVIFTFLAERWIKPLRLGPQPDGPSRNITGVAGNYASMSSPNTLDLALQLQPDTRHVVVIVGSYDYEKMWLAQWRKDLARYAEKLDVTFLTDLPMAELQKRVAALPPHSVILYPFFARDSDGQFFLPEEALDMIRARANAPVYGMFPLYLEHEVVGCRCVDLNQDGEEVAILAARVLAGEKAGKIPIVVKDTSRNVVDWRQLKRWGIGESRVPPGTEVLHRERTLWEEYGLYLVGAIVLLVLETGLLAALVIQHRRRRRAERDLKEAEERYSKAFRNSPEGVTLSTLHHGRFLEVNDAFARMVGFDKHELVGRTVDELKLWVDPQERERMVARATTHEIVHDEECGIRHKSGRILRMRLSVEIIEIQRETCLVIVSRDVTEQKRLEQSLRQAQKMEAIGLLAGGVAHDFNNLLGVILGYSELLKNKLVFDPQLYRRLEAIENAGKTAAGLTTQLLAFSRMQMLQPKILNMNSTVTEAVAMLRRLIGEDIQLEVLLNPDPGQIKADAGQLLQVLMNLALNARDAMPKGGSLILQTSATSFSPDASLQGISIPAGRYVTLVVRDTGLGMDEETREHIFEPFFTTKPLGKGTGLGLATVYGIVKQSGGFIFVESEKDAGTTFTIYLPEVSEVAETAQEGNISPRRDGSETILLAEDDRELREMLREHLCDCGYNLLCAANGREAIRIAGSCKEPIDLLITDVIMPQMSGPDLARELGGARPAMKILFISGYAGDKLAEISNPPSGTPLIQKPFALTDLSLKIREILNQGPGA